MCTTSFDYDHRRQRAMYSPPAAQSSTSISRGQSSSGVISRFSSMIKNTQPSLSSTSQVSTCHTNPTSLHWYLLVFISRVVSVFFQAFNFLVINPQEFNSILSIDTNRKSRQHFFAKFIPTFDLISKELSLLLWFWLFKTNVV